MAFVDAMRNLSSSAALERHGIFMSFKSLVKSIPVIGFCARKALHAVTQPWRLFPPYWLSRWLKGDDVLIVQIGANDGRTGDPIFDLLKRNRQWRAILVEPVPFLFERLKVNYGAEERFRFENTLIGDGREKMFHWVAEEAKDAVKDLPYWFDQLAGFNRSHITNHLPQLEPFVREAKLPSISLTALFEKHAVGDIDLLHIDTEGGDYVVLSQLDLKRYRPSLILIETIHLSPEDRQRTDDHLRRHYELFDFGADWLAVEKDLAASRRSLLKSMARFHRR